MAMKSRKQTESKEGRGYTKQDWEDVSNNPEWTDEELRGAKPFAEVFPDLTENIKRGRGRPKVDNPKVAVTIRLDPEVLAKFKATGKDWRAKLNEVIAKAKV